MLKSILSALASGAITGTATAASAGTPIASKATLSAALAGSIVGVFNLWLNRPTVKPKTQTATQKG